jgi:hypothetical protein
LAPSLESPPLLVLEISENLESDQAKNHLWSET